MVDTDITLVGGSGDLYDQWLPLAMVLEPKVIIYLHESTQILEIMKKLTTISHHILGRKH